MSWSLKITNGDLSIGAGQMETVTRDAKLVQDFRHFLLTRLGSDVAYPWYGSNLDDLVSTTDWRFAEVQIESEVRRIANRYQRLQLERAKADRLRYNKSTLTVGEILAAVTAVKFEQRADQLK